VTELLNTFSTLCFKIKEDIFRKLDDQVTTLKQNYGYYKSKLNNFYSKTEEVNNNPTKEEIVNRLNRAPKIDAYELIIKNICDDLSETKILEGSLE